MALKRVDYDERQHVGYAVGRAMPDDVRARWMSVFAEHLPPERPLPLADLGSGVGRLTPALAVAFGGPVYGVEPSQKMRAIAEAAGSPPEVVYLAGEAAQIPLANASVAAVLMFLSFHHVPDRAAAAAEIARVLRPGGKLLIHSGFSDRMGMGTWWHTYFPRARLIELEMFPSVAEAAAAFAPVGLRPLALVEVPARFADSLSEAAQRLRLRAVSTFEHLTEDEIAEGFAKLDAAVAAEVWPAPIVGTSDLLVLGQG